MRYPWGSTIISIMRTQIAPTCWTVARIRGDIVSKTSIQVAQHIETSQKRTWDY